MRRLRILGLAGAVVALFVAGVAGSQTDKPGALLDSVIDAIQATLTDHEERIDALENPPTSTTEPPPTSTEEPPTTTEPPPTTTEPPPTTTGDDPPPPPPPPALPVRPQPNEVVETTRDWRCTSPQDWPISVTVNAPNVRPQGETQDFNGDVQLDWGCHARNAGGQDGVCDLYLNVNGNGATLGSASDGMVMRGVEDLDVCGVLGETDLECGGGQSHKDGVQMNYADRVHFWEFQSGDWKTKTTTCHGAGGMFYLDQLDKIQLRLTDVVCHSCVFVGGLPGAPGGVGVHFGAATDSGAIGSCFMGRPGIRYEGNFPIRPIDVNNVEAHVDSDQPAPPCPALERL